MLSRCFLNIIWLVPVSHAGAAVLFADDFSTSQQSDDVNYQYPAGRQSGSLGVIPYRQGNGSYSSTIPGSISDEAGTPFYTQINNAAAPQTLLLAGQFDTIASVSPEYNFVNNPGIGNHLSISFALDPVTTGSGPAGDWGAITLGAANSTIWGGSGAGGRGQFINQAAPHFGILFRDDGRIQAFDGGNDVTGGTVLYTTTPGGFFNFELRITGLLDGNPWDGVNAALIDVHVNGGAVPFYSFTKAGGYNDNFLTLQSLGSSSGSTSITLFDDFQVAIIPEPGCPFLFVAVSLVVRHRRRW